MKFSAHIAGLGLLVLGGGTAFAQAAPSVPGPIGPDANSSASSSREQSQGFTHVMNNLDRQQPAKSTGAVRKATAADISVGAAVRDVNGQTIGKIASLNADGVVIDTGQSKVKVPLIGVGKDNSGLLLGITAAKFNQLVASAHAAVTAAAPAKAGPRPATAADITAGAALRDVNGQAIGKITSVAADGATVDTGQTKVKLPLDTFGVDSGGLMIAITGQKLNEIIAQAQASAGKK